MTGGAEFDEVFFTDVSLPADHLLGPLHGGWGVGMGVLTNERGHIGTAVISLERRLEQISRSAPSATLGAADRAAAGSPRGRPGTRLQVAGPARRAAATTAARC